MSKHRPFQFGVNANANAREDWVATARMAEDLGYYSLLPSDHLGDSFGAIAALVSAAEATTTLRLGSYVFGNDFRDPVFLAQEAASIDILSGGRLDLGMGTGYAGGDYAQSGVALESPGVRVSRLEEAVQIIKGFFADDPFSFSGDFYNVEGLNGQLRSVQRPHPPLMLGGGARRTLSLAAREADIVSVNIRTTSEGGFDFGSISAEAAAQKIEWVRQAAGARFDDLTINLLVPLVAVTENREEAAQAALDQYGIPPDVLTVEQLLESPSALIGSIDQIVDTLQERREHYGFSYISIWQPMEQFAHVVDRLAGK